MKRPDYKWIALALLFVAFFLHQGTRQIFGAMLPQIQSFFGVNRTEIGVVGSVFQLAYGLSLPFMGFAADRFGRKGMVVTGVALFCGGIFLGGFASGVGVLALAYGLLNGLGQSAYYPGTMSLVSQLHSESRATAFSIMQCGLYGGILICSVSAGWVAGLSSEAWRWPFWAFGGLGLTWAAVLFFFLRNTPPASETVKTAKPSVRAAFGSILPEPCFWLLTLALGMMIYVDVGFKIWTPTYLRDAFPSLTPGSAALHAVLWHYLGAFCGITLAAKVTDRLAKVRRGIRMEINLIGLACAVPFILLMAKADTLPMVCLGMGLFGFFRGVYDSNILASLFDVIDPRYHATASSCMLALAASIGSAAPTVLGWIGDHATLRDGFASLSGFYLVGAALIAVARLFFLGSALRKR